MIKWSAISFSIRILAAGLAILFTMLLTHILGESEFGRFSLLSSLYALALIVVQLGFPVVVTRSYYQGGEAETVGFTMRLSNYWITATSLLAALGVCAFSLVSASGGAVFAVLLPPLLFATAQSNVVSGRLRALDAKILSMVFEQLTKYIVPIPVLFIGARLFDFQWTATSALGVIASGFAISAVLASVLSSRLDKLEYKAGLWRPFGLTRPNRAFARPILFSAALIALIQMYGVVNRNLDLVFISHFLGLAATGEYRIAVVMSTAILFSVPAVTNIVAAQILREHVEDPRALQVTMTKAAWIVFVTSATANLTMILSARFLVETMFGPAYEGAVLPLYALSALQGVASAFGISSYLLNLAGFERSVFRNSWIAIAINLLGNLALIPTVGTLGAAIATGLSGIAFSVLNWLAARRLTGVDSSIFHFLHKSAGPSQPITGDNQ